MHEERLNRCAAFGLLHLLLFDSLVFSNLVKFNCLGPSSLLIVHGVGLLARSMICHLEETVAVVIVQEAHHFLDLLILLGVGFLSESLAARAGDHWTLEFLLVDPVSLE